jgi:hypothetical protein
MSSLEFRATQLSSFDIAALSMDGALQAHWCGIRQWIEPYRNHVLRVMAYCLALRPTMDPFELGVAGAFHDLGMWTSSTWDYLPPSIRLARQWLIRNRHSAATYRVQAMIKYHHKLTRYAGPHQVAVETFRRADWIDLTRGRISFGLSASTIGAINTAYPDLGFHAFLRRRTLQAFLRTPLRPLPMLKW